MVPTEIEDNAYANILGKTRCIMEDVQMANRSLKENDSCESGSIRVFRVNTSHV